VLTGLMASIMCFAEARGSVDVAALLTVCASSTAFTMDAAAALEKVVPSLNQRPVVLRRLPG
jgi:hypothetical protein